MNPLKLAKLQPLFFKITLLFAPAGFNLYTTKLTMYCKQVFEPSGIQKKIITNQNIDVDVPLT